VDWETVYYMASRKAVLPVVVYESDIAKEGGIAMS